MLIWAGKRYKIEFIINSIINNKPVNSFKTAFEPFVEVSGYRTIVLINSYKWSINTMEKIIIHVSVFRSLSPSGFNSISINTVYMVSRIKENLLKSLWRIVWESNISTNMFTTTLNSS